MTFSEQFFAEFPCLRGDGVTLRQIGPEDAPDLLEMVSDPSLYEMKPGEPVKTLSAAEHMTGWWARDFAKRKVAFIGLYADELGGRLSGVLEAFDVDDRVGAITVGYTLKRAAWGRGLATRGMRLLLAHLFDTVSLLRAQAFIMPANARSVAVVERLGFAREGLLRQAEYWKGRGVVDVYVYGLLKADWDAREQQAK